MTHYIVIVYPPPPTTRSQTDTFYTAGSVQTTLQPKVQRIKASSPKSAGENAKVPPGGYVLVVAEENVQRFNRAKVAPLEYAHANGEPLAMDSSADA